MNVCIKSSRNHLFLFVKVNQTPTSSPLTTALLSSQLLRLRRVGITPRKAPKMSTGNNFQMALMEFQHALDTKLPLRHIFEFYDDTKAKKVVQQQIERVKVVFQRKHPDASLDDICLMLQELHGSLEVVVCRWKAKNAEHRSLAEAKVEKLIEILCDQLKTSIEAEISLHPEMKLQALEKCLREETKVAIRYFHDQFKHRNMTFYNEQLGKLEVKLSRIGNEFHEKLSNFEETPAEASTQNDLLKLKNEFELQIPTTEEALHYIEEVLINETTDFECECEQAPSESESGRSSPNQADNALILSQIKQEVKWNLGEETSFACDAYPTVYFGEAEQVQSQEAEIMEKKLDLKTLKHEGTMQPEEEEMRGGHPVTMKKFKLDPDEDQIPISEVHSLSQSQSTRMSQSTPEIYLNPCATRTSSMTPPSSARVNASPNLARVLKCQTCKKIFLLTMPSKSSLWEQEKSRIRNKKPTRYKCGLCNGTLK